MTERMVEALEIEGKFHEVHWYDDEGHGWERRENRRDAFGRIVAFLRTHVLDEHRPVSLDPEALDHEFKTAVPKDGRRGSTRRWAPAGGS